MFSSKTQGLAALAKLLFWNHPTEELCFQTPANTSHFDFKKTQQKPTKTGCCFEAFNPRLISRVYHGSIMVSSRVWKIMGFSQRFPGPNPGSL